jgi:hypothetical protein
MILVTEQAIRAEKAARDHGRYAAEIASGHTVTADPVAAAHGQAVARLQEQPPLVPADAVTLTSDTTGAALGSSIRNNPGTVTVVHLDAAGAASPHLAAALGPACPSGLPGQVPALHPDNPAPAASSGPLAPFSPGVS